MPDIVAISETWLTPDISNSIFVPTNSYFCFRKDRQAGSGGGVFLMIKKSQYISVHQVPLSAQYDNAELICVDVSDHTGSLPLRIVVAYRPPDYSSSENALLFSALDSLADDCVRLCVLGDFNLPLTALLMIVLVFVCWVISICP